MTVAVEDDELVVVELEVAVAVADEKLDDDALAVVEALAVAVSKLVADVIALVDIENDSKFDKEGRGLCRADDDTLAEILERTDCD